MGMTATRSGPARIGLYARLNPFNRLRALLADREPAVRLPAISLAIGESQHPPPHDLLRSLGGWQGWCRYPPVEGTASLRKAYASWLAQHFGLESDAAGLGLEPTPGTKQAVFSFIASAVRRSRDRGVDQPYVAIPNPFYPTYLSAIGHASATPIFASAPYAGIAEQVKRACGDEPSRLAAVVVCSPSNPEGECLSMADYAALFALSDASKAVIIVDECYRDLYLAGPPAAALSAVLEHRGSFAGLVVLHSLSKRSSVPGLRSGFASGDADLIDDYADMNRGGGVSTSEAVCASAAALWLDEAHVARHRKKIAEAWSMADSYLGHLPGYAKPPAGFYLWFPVADDERCAATLWERCSLKVLPGRYLGAADAAGRNPGRDWVRIALVHENDVMDEALRRLADYLPQQVRI